MNGYPASMAALAKMFPSQEACLDYLAALRGPSPQGFACRQCGGGKAWRRGNGLWLCAGCRRQQSVRGGTVFQDTHLPVQTRFRAVWRICANQNGMSARNLQRLLGIGSYGTAWLCLHKLRRAMVGPGRDRLAGTVEADECYLGGPGEGKRGRGASGRQSVFVAAELRGHKIGRIRLSGLPDVSGATLDKAVSGAAGGGASVRTDGWKGCNGIGKPGYRREISVPADAGLADIVLPKRHLVASLLKRWTLGTLPGNIGADHVQDYLNEFTFRFNRRSSKSRGLLFYRLAELSVATGPAPRALIVPPKGAG